ncbi:MAG: NAD(P)H-dependent glycerol-3-phosphate dehydrogenase [Myxococcota bacterium]
MGDKATRIGVLGGGSWGTALAQLLAAQGHRVTLWALEPEVVAGINEEHKNPLYMSDLTLARSIWATGDQREAVVDAEMVLSVIPAQFVRENLVALRDHLPPGIPLVICSKGIERQTLANMHQVFEDELPSKSRSGVCVLSGPSFAAEVARNMPTNVTVAATDHAVAEKVQGIISTRNFRVYTTDDVVGVEIGGALKNVIAIAVGASDGLGLGNNARAGLITRGLAELTRLAVSLGGRPETMLGLAGVGDLILTCTSDLSRNRTVGRMLAQGKTPDEIQREMRQVAEGVPTSASAYNLANKQNVDLPIIEQVYRVLHGGETVHDAMKALQDRALKAEWSV